MTYKLIWLRAQAQRAASLLFAVVADGAEHGGATLSFQQRMFQQQVPLFSEQPLTFIFSPTGRVC